MAIITYKDASSNKNKWFAIRVSMDGRTQGFIRKEKDGSGYYFARGLTRGETFPSVEAVKRSLEAV
jgi:hypothetical protein